MPWYSIGIRAIVPFAAAAGKGIAVKAPSFKTMLSGTPAHPTTDKIGYAGIRLPIAGVLGKAGSVYTPHGVAFDKCGLDTYERGNTKKHVAFVNDEWGQTGANSSMFKFFDAILGVLQNEVPLKLPQNTWAQLSEY